MGDIGEERPGVIEIIPLVSPTDPHEPPARHRQPTPASAPPEGPVHPDAAPVRQAPPAVPVEAPR